MTEDQMQEIAIQLKYRIDNMFSWVHPKRGERATCATGEPYKVYGIAFKSTNDVNTAIEMLARAMEACGIANGELI